MEIADPRVDLSLVPTGSKSTIIKGNGDTILDLPSIITPRGAIITRWSPTDEERARIASGEDLYLTIWSHGRPIDPICLSVGVCDWTHS